MPNLIEPDSTSPTRVVAPHLALAARNGSYLAPTHVRPVYVYFMPCNEQPDDRQITKASFFRLIAPLPRGTLWTLWSDQLQAQTCEIPSRNAAKWSSLPVGQVECPVFSNEP